MLLRRHRRTAGQALVELALSITFIFLLVAAAVDLGLIFFTLQGMRTAAQEGATFGSYAQPQYNSDGSLRAVDLRYTEIATRVRNANGATSTGFANLQDLDSNGVRDVLETSNPLHTNPQNPDAWIYVELLQGTNASNLSPATETVCPKSVAGRGMQRGGANCWIRVTVRYNYQMQFPFAPSFGSVYRLEVRQVMPVRSPVYTS